MADDQDDVVIRPFPAFLMDIHQGRIATELAERLHEIVEAVQTHEKVGSLTLSIKIEPMKDVADTLVVTADIKAKIPEAKLKGAVFFSDAYGNLVRENPDKPRLPLREVGGPKIEPGDEPIEATAREVEA